MPTFSRSSRLLAGSFMIALIGSLSACSGPAVQRVDANEEIALTDRWNAKDSQLVANAMIDDMLTFPWVEQHYQRHQRKPTVIIQRIRNHSHEQIESETFVNDLKRAMIRSGRIDFVVANAERNDLRDERRDQELNSSLQTRSRMGEETGANFALSGSINSFVDEAGRKRVTAYQVDLKLIEMETNREVWNGQKKLQKVQNKPLFGF